MASAANIRPATNSTWILIIHTQSPDHSDSLTDCCLISTSLLLRERAVCDVDAVVGGAYFVVVGGAYFVVVGGAYFVVVGGAYFVAEANILNIVYSYQSI